MKQLKQLLLMMLAVVMICANAVTVYADEDDNDNDSSSESTIDYVSDEWKEHIRGNLNKYYTDLKARYDLTDEKLSLIHISEPTRRVVR